MWSIGHTKRRMLQDKTAHPRMIEYFPSLRHTQNLMARPPLTKLRTLMLEQFDYLFEPPITHAYASIRTKLRQHASRNQLPVIIELSGCWFAEEVVQNTPFHRRNTTEPVHYHTRGPIPSENVPTLSANVSWRSRQLIQDTLQGRTDCFLHFARRSLRLPSQL